jgi:hypothetical protein
MGDKVKRQITVAAVFAVFLAVRYARENNALAGTEIYQKQEDASK